VIRKPLLAGLGALAVVIGLVWVGQGVGLLPGSAMSGERTWLVIGAVVVVLGAVLLVLSTRGRSSRDPNGPPGQH